MKDKVVKLREQKKKMMDKLFIAATDVEINKLMNDGNEYISAKMIRKAIKVLEAYNPVSDISEFVAINEEVNKIFKPVKCDVCPYKQIVAALRLSWKQHKGGRLI